MFIFTVALVRCEVLQWACLCVFLSTHISKTACPNFTKCSVRLNCGCGHSFADDSVVQCTSLDCGLPVVAFWQQKVNAKC